MHNAGGKEISTKQPRKLKSRPAGDRGNSKDRILVVAAEEFARRGYDGARVDEIVRRGKINKNLIYYYYGSKEALFVAVLESAYLKLRHQLDTLKLDDIAPQEAIEKLVVELFQFWASSTEFIGFLTSENLYKARHIKKSPIARTAYNNLIGQITSVLERGAKCGVFRSGVDPVDLYISISALGFQYFANQHTLSVVLGRDLTSKRVVRDRLRHIVDVIMGYLQYKKTKGSKAGSLSE